MFFNSARSLFLYTFFFTCINYYGQYPLHIILDKSVEKCTKASALVRIEGQGYYDSLTIGWSTGEMNVPTIKDLSAGAYSVHVRFLIKDSLWQIKDTSIYFTIEKEPCPVLIPRYFSPNGDGYNDLLMLGYIENYPNFEFMVYNKWGQRVHHQQSNYTPWDGKWLGSNLADGTYYYVLFYDKENKNDFINGDVTIIR